MFSLLCLRCWQEPAGPFGGLCSAAVHSAHHPVQSPETFPDGQNRPGVAHALYWYIVTATTHTDRSFLQHGEEDLAILSLVVVLSRYFSAVTHRTSHEPFNQRLLLIIPSILNHSVLAPPTPSRRRSAAGVLALFLGC